MAACVTHKKMFTSKEMAEDALIEARIKFNYAKESGPVAVYKCDDCGHYHLTSTGSMNERLKKFIDEGKVKLHKEANYWSDKLSKH